MTNGASKSAVRAAALGARRTLSPSDRAALSEQIALRLLGLDAFDRARTIALYAPMGAEVDTGPIARAAVDRGQRTAYPRLVAGSRVLEFAASTPSNLVAGALGTREPPRTAPSLDPASLDLVLVPGVAFDDRCHRVGRGGGYYDATLATLPARTLRIGLAFEAQLVGEVPDEPHDAALDAVVTEARVVFRLPPGAAKGRS